MIDLSVKGLVQFMTGDDAQRRRVLAAFKFPDIGKPPRSYYREAIPAIRSARQCSIDVSGRQVGVLELASGTIHVGKRIGVRLERRIAAALANIEALWPTIVRPAKLLGRAGMPAGLV